MRIRTCLYVCLAALASAGPATLTQQPLPFDKGWDLQGDRTAIVAEGDRQVLELESGEAHHRDVRFTDGTIDFDVQLTDRRSFVYVYFRVAEDGDREEFYLRPHKSNLPDAVQYAPVWQGRSAWQLHHGPGGTAAVGFTPGRWTHVRVAVRGRQAAIFIDDMATPALFVPRLAREPRAGHIAVRGFLPANVPGAGPIARFADVTVSSGVSFDFDAAAAKAVSTAPALPGAGIVRAWSVSRAFVPEDGARLMLPASDVTGPYTWLQTETDGLLSLHRYVKVATNSPNAAAVAKVTVRAVSTGRYAFELGFSDIATVFLNGQPLFTGNASYSFDRPRREGLIGYDQARLYLPLHAGDNEIAVVISDSFGGWGLMGRFVSSEGLTIVANR